MHIRTPVQPRHYLFQKPLGCSFTFLDSKLGDPDWSALRNLPRRIDVLFEVCHICADIVPVNCDKVDITVRALFQKGAQPAEAGGGCVWGVGDGGGAQIQRAFGGFERLDVLFPTGNGVVDRDAGAAGAGAEERVILVIILYCVGFGWCQKIEVPREQGRR